MNPSTSKNQNERRILLKKEAKKVNENIIVGHNIDLQSLKKDLKHKRELWLVSHGEKKRSYSHLCECLELEITTTRCRIAHVETLIKLTETQIQLLHAWGEKL